MFESTVKRRARPRIVDKEKSAEYAPTSHRSPTSIARANTLELPRSPTQQIQSWISRNSHLPASHLAFTHSLSLAPSPNSGSGGVIVPACPTDERHRKCKSKEMP